MLAPALIETVEQIGLPCETALEKGIEGVRDPRISIGAVTVDGDAATAQVRSSAAGQEPSEDTVRLVRVDDAWRIASLGQGQGAPGALGAVSTPDAGSVRDGLGGPPMRAPRRPLEACGHEPENPHPPPARGLCAGVGPRRPRRWPAPPRSPGRATPSATRPRPARPTSTGPWYGVVDESKITISDGYGITVTDNTGGRCTPVADRFECDVPRG